MYARCLLFYDKKTGAKKKGKEKKTAKSSAYFLKNYCMEFFRKYIKNFILRNENKMRNEIVAKVYFEPLGFNLIFSFS